MTGFPSSTAIPYPTPYLQGLFPSLRAELAQLEDCVRLASGMDGRDHRRMIAIVDRLLTAHYESLALFLAHPTRRLSELLLTAVTQAEEALAWLLDHPPAPPIATPSDFSYAGIGERVRRGIADWRLSIVLHRTYYDLDQVPVEALH